MGQKVVWEFDDYAFQNVTTEAKSFISKCLIRVPEMRMSAADALKHPWLSASFTKARKNNNIKPSEMRATDKRLYSEEEEYIVASLVFRTFDEEEYESPEESDEEEDFQNAVYYNIDKLVEHRIISFHHLFSH